MGVLLNAAGTPQPPAEILRGLRNLDPAFGLRFSPGPLWAITWEWPERDPRWARVRAQEISRDSAYDIIGYLPVDCPLDQAVAYVSRAFKAYPIEEVKKFMSRISHWNDVEVPKAQTQAVIADTLDGFASDQRQQNPRRRRIIPARAD